MKATLSVVIISLIAIVIVAVFFVSSIPLTDERGNSVRLKHNEASLVAEKQVEVIKTPKQVLKALVKGSIYETGEFVSVFGTCLNASDQPLEIGTWASISSWYPNGSSDMIGVNMTEIQPGYYVYTGYMNAVQGTYLTEMICHVNGSDEIAKAWGEWQNPYWVKRIELLNNSLGNISEQITLLGDNITLTLGNITTNLTNQFEITWQNQNYTNVLINETRENLTQQIVWAAGVANASVDRNDSYLAYLMWLMINSSGVPITHNLTLDIDYDDPVYFKKWEVRVEVKNEYNVSVGYPLISCFVNTTNIPPTENQQMTPATVMRWTRRDHSADIGFKWSEKIYSEEFEWSVWCAYN